LQIMPPQQEIADLTITPETVLNLRSCLNWRLKSPPVRIRSIHGFWKWQLLLCPSH
jgi:hypothetical protein